MIDHDTRYWRYQYDVMQYFIPRLLRCGVHVAGASVLDIGCGSGGGTCALHDAGARCFGFDNDIHNVEVALRFRQWRSMYFACWDVCQDLRFTAPQYDLVVLHDVLEHLADKAGALKKIRGFVRPDGRVFITFPPWYSAYGGHQQRLPRLVHNLPFVHLLPGVPQLLPADRMGMRAFERLASAQGLHVLQRWAYLVSPNHIRYGMRPIPAGILGRIPLVSEVLCSGAAYLLSVDNLQALSVSPASEPRKIVKVGDGPGI